MGFGEHYLNVFSVLTNLELTSSVPVKLAEGMEIAIIKVLKALLPDPASLAPSYTGKTCIGNYVKGTKDNKQKAIFIYNSSVIMKNATKK